MMSKVLIIPDVHARKFWIAAKDAVNNFDRIIFLGDYVDPYSNEDCRTLYDPLDCLKEVITFKKNNKDKVILLFGNHILHYLWTNFPQSSRFDRIRQKAYYSLLSDNINFFNLGWIENDVIFTHAGITESWKDEIASLLGIENASYLEIGNFLQNTNINEFDKKLRTVLGMISFYRGGIDNTGSCEWADIYEHVKTSPIEYPNCYQVFGHTQLKAPCISNTWACLDCRKIFVMNVETHEIEEYKI